MHIDAHHHLWDLDAVHYPWLMARGEVRFFGDPEPIQRNYLLDEYRSDAAQQGFAGSVHIQVGAEDGWEEARWVDALSRSTPDWPLLQVAFCDLTSPQREAQLDRLQSLPSLRGIRQIVGRAPGEDANSGTQALLQSDAFLEGLHSLAARDLSFDLQLIPALLPDAARLLARVPELRVALCHAGSPHDRSQRGIARWAESLQALAALPGVVCKLSGLRMFDHQWQVEDFAPLVETCLDQFGAERCLFGSNFPVDSLSSSYATLVDAYRQLIPANDQSEVFGGTAYRFYRFGLHSAS